MAQTRAYNQTITVERQTPTVDSMGGEVPGTWATISSATSSIAALGYKHSEKPQHAMADFARIDWKGDFVWQTSVNCTARPGDRVNHGGVYYQIHDAFNYSNPWSGRGVYVMDCTLVRVGAGTT